MALWGKTDAVGSNPKWLAKMVVPAGTTVVFVDNVEAQQQDNKDRGLKSPGWWLYKSWTNADGSIQYSTEHLVALRATPAAAGDQADDAIVSDATIKITTAPVSKSVATGSPTTFAVVAAIAPSGTMTYQWQTNGGAGTSYSNIANAGVYSGATTATLAISNVAGLNNYKYRVIVSSTNAASKTTTGVTLTVT